MTLGVSNESVEIVDYSQEWPKAFLAEKARIGETLGAMATVIEHIGSTSIPGMASKPIIDIAVGTHSSEMIEPVIKRLAEIGYLSRGYRGQGLGTILELKKADLRTHCIHLLDTSVTNWNDSIVFRDALRDSAKMRDAYQSLKYELAQKYSTDRKRYTQEKNRFVEKVLAAINGREMPTGQLRD